MKTKFYLIVLFIFPFVSYAQDTLFVKKKAPIICKVSEIGIDEIKYKAWDNLEGPVIVIYKSDIYKISYQNGKSELIVPDELDINKEAEILDKRSVLKFGMFSLLNNHFSIGYERVLSVGKNIEAKIAYVGIGANPSGDDVSGFYSKFGFKFLIGNDYYIKGMKYIHPLKGRYIKPELIYSFVFEKNKAHYSYSGYQYNSQQIYYDQNSSSIAINLVYGRQFILGNVITIDYSVGVGYGFIITTNTKNLSLDSWESYRSDYYSHFYFSKDFPLTVTAGLNIGFIIK